MRYRLILKEEAELKKQLIYHISGDSNLDKIIMKPRVPDQPIQGEDNKTPRISFAKTIDGCLAGIFPIHPGTDLDDPRYTEYPNGYDFYVYTPIGKYTSVSNEDIIKRRLVPDAGLSKEVWVTSPIKVKKIGKIHVEPFNPKTAKTFVYTMYFKDHTKKGLGIKFKWKWVDKT
jgi:hypothetical protein